jgi:hypothetical protein
MRNAVTLSAVFCMLTFAPAMQCQDPPSDALFSPDQLDNLLAPIALYPDPLLAQVLVAATFPDQIDEAARFIRADSNPDAIDGQSWDVSVKAVAHYPTVLYMMADQLDWATSLGQAYVNQPDDVMGSVQRLRADAQAAGNLESNADMQVVDDGGEIEIWPAQPQFIYVPDYDPGMVYIQRVGFNYGPGFPIGAWLNVDFNWRAHQIFYHGWNGSQGWIGRSRPFVRKPVTYVNEKYRKVAVNHDVGRHPVNYSSLNRFQSVHREVGYDHLRPDNPGRAGKAPAGNKILERNDDTHDTRMNDYRGHVQELPRPQADRTPVQEPPRRQADRTPAPEPPRREMNRPQPPSRPVEQHPDRSAFGGNQGGFNPRESSQRGQSSRQEMQRPAPAPRQESRPAPAPRQEPPSRSAPATRDEGGKRR